MLKLWGVAFLALSSLSWPGAPSARSPSTCRGTTANGLLELGWRLPRSGPNFVAYSRTAWLLGRTYVHSEVHATVLAAYAELEGRAPGTRFVYGETGWRRGGRFRPHKTHQNGLSVDFMVPVRDREGASVPLPAHAFNQWGYELEFDAEGRLASGYRIDFDAMALHLGGLDRAAASRGIALRRVIFDPQLQPLLRASPHWDEIARLRFSDRRSWVRHDEHYHVDFSVPCEPSELGAASQVGPRVRR